MKNIIIRVAKKILEKIRDLLHVRQLLVFIGDTGTYVAAYKGSKLKKSLFISGEEYDINKHKTFFDKYKKYTALIVLDKQTAELYHSQILGAQSLLPIDHVGKFISKTIDKNDVVASNVFDVTNDGTSETWHTVLTSTKETPTLSALVSYFVSDYAKFKGIYFLSLNIPNLIRASSSASKIVVSSKLQIFVTITSFSGVRVFVCQDQNIMESHFVAFPYDKSLEYVQGVIEQAVSDCVISLKNYIHHHQERPSLVLMAPKEMQVLLRQSKFDVGEVIIIPTESNDSFADCTLSYFLNKNVEHKGSNVELLSFSKAMSFNKLFFKPLWLIMAAFIFFLGKNALEIRKNYRKASKTNEKYYNVSEEYRKQREQYPYIDKFGAIVDFHNAMISLSAPQQLPFDTLDKFLLITPANLNLYSIDWDSKRDGVITVEAKYSAKNSDTNAVLTFLESDLINIQKALPDCNVELIKNTNAIMNSGGFVSIPLKLIITKKGVE